MRLIVVRHGQTVCNTNDIWHGWDDCELTVVGLAQAQAVGARLAALHLDAVYSSDSRRALQTAAAIATPHGLAPIPEPRLRERKAGDFEGVPTDDVVALHPTVWDDRAADYWGWRPPGGETFREVLQRTLGVVDRLKARHDGQTVALVTHMGPVRVLMSHLAGIPMEQTYQEAFPSTAVSIFSFEGDRVGVEALNDATHVIE
jgi:broad specificity phosphatase PhoE